ncbi:uncharacterized protein LOC123509290 [Portunus trituberculatus]|uniref:uncharacterized protein LOC123509290 n=1 Tax=Portunus trituberculatus TaxID=210409 RepID=UPI001E1CE38E|nr:uncharacterized protein LOC123509290 [Portunus trituberculatus]
MYLAHTMNTLQFFIAALLVHTAAGITAAGHCLPDCSGHNAGDFVADPYNCTQFYVCLADELPSDHPVPCVSGHFENGICQGTEDCTPQCLPSLCHMTCNEPLDLISEPTACSIYYVCDAALHPTQELRCPFNKPYFDGKLCTTDSDACCSDLCTPYCHPGFVQIPDPLDCLWYYICIETGAPNPALHYKCDDGMVFNIGSGRCEYFATCVTLCQA